MRFIALWLLIGVKIMACDATNQNGNNNAASLIAKYLPRPGPGDIVINYLPFEIANLAELTKLDQLLTDKAILAITFHFEFSDQNNTNPCMVKEKIIASEYFSEVAIEVCDDNASSFLSYGQEVAFLLDSVKLQRLQLIFSNTRLKDYDLLWLDSVIQHQPHLRYLNILCEHCGLNDQRFIGLCQSLAVHMYGIEELRLDLRANEFSEDAVNKEELLSKFHHSKNHQLEFVPNQQLCSSSPPNRSRRGVTITAFVKRDDLQATSHPDI